MIVKVKVKEYLPHYVFDDPSDEEKWDKAYKSSTTFFHPSEFPSARLVDYSFVEKEIDVPEEVIDCIAERMLKIFLDSSIERVRNKGD